MVIPLGFVIGAYGTLIGAGGGFVLVPILLLLYPQATPETITGISLAVCLLQCPFRLRRLRPHETDRVPLGLLFSAAAIPGAILGALATPYMPRRLFDGIFPAFC